MTANLAHTYDGRWLKVGLDNWAPDRDLDVVFVERERALLSSGIAPWGDDFREVCQDAMGRPVAERRLLADKIEGMYGAPATVDSSFADALASGPMEFCRSSYYIQGIARKEPDFMPHVGLNLRYLPDPTYPDNMSQALKMCLVQLREPN